MIGTHQPKVLALFYEEVVGKKPDMNEGDWCGWLIGKTFLSVGSHSEIKGKSKEPQRVIINFETKQVKEEFERIKQVEGALVVKEPYEIGGALIVTFADPDGNYFQLMTPWEG